MINLTSGPREGGGVQHIFYPGPGPKKKKGPWIFFLYKIFNIYLVNTNIKCINIL
jgi:hypothetical protein